MVDTESSPVPVEKILVTEQLDRRSSRMPDYERENLALATLIQALTNSPQTLLQKLADSILDLLHCGSAGISLLSTKDGGKNFSWAAIAGEWRRYIGRNTPRDFAPCGDVLDRDSPLLFQHVNLRYHYFDALSPQAQELLAVPFYSEGKAVGTIWAVAHDSAEFDSEDRRLLLSLARVATAAHQSIAGIDASRHLAAIVESSDDAIISKNLDGIISTWNRSAERLFGYAAQEAIGQHITLIIPKDRHQEEDTIIGQIRRGQRIDHFETIRQHKDGTLLDISVTVSPVKDSEGRVIGASKVARDITQLREAERARKEIEVSARLRQVQDSERRRLARELHDGVGQLLVAIGMNEARIMDERGKLDPQTARCVEENAELVNQASSEIRTVSYLLHPPLLDEVGLQSALRLYLEGFSERSKIDVTLELDSIDRLSQDKELSLFRIAQECLTNIHRHSGSPTATIRLAQRPGEVTLEVKDAGRGISKETLSQIFSGASHGVGFRGMQERVKLIGATFTLKSDAKGTSVKVVVPVVAKRETTQREVSESPRVSKLA